MKIELNKFSKDLSPRELLLIKITLVVFILWLIHWIFSPKMLELNQKKRNLEAAYKRWESQEKHRETNISLSNIQDERENLIKKVPTKNPISDFIVDLEVWSGEDNIQWISLDSNTGDDLISLKLHLKGKLTALLNIISLLEQYPIAIDIDNIELARIYGNDGGIYPQNTLEEWEVKLSVALYYLEKSY